MFEEGSKAVRLVGRQANFYEDYLTTNLYVERPFGAVCNSITLSNDSDTDAISASFDGATVEAELKPRETLTLNVARETGIYIKGAAGGDQVRIWGW